MKVALFYMQNRSESNTFLHEKSISLEMIVKAYLFFL
jgi:hypothetical protein